jgi:hypothetical protein
MELRFRQIHLDFHTSQHISQIGSAFDPDEFAETLVRARVNSVTCFARCHHGYIYYDTKINPERRHPHLTRNLLAEQIEACHRRDIRVPIYTTIQWDHFTADEHPDWLAVGQDGRIQGTPPYEAGFYRNLLVNSPYMDFLKAHVQEICQSFPVDGFFFDIVGPLNDSSVWARRGMLALGLDPADNEARIAFGQRTIDDFKLELSAFVRGFHPEATIFFNAGHVSPFARQGFPANSHLELESLPSTGQWGYLHYPLTSRYARTLGMDNLGMTGKFHTTWGDFHSFKNSAALQYECFRMLALNSKCSVGDQLQPDGKICQATYDLIGSVYQEVEKREPWCKNTREIVDIGLFNTEEFTRNQVPLDASGAVLMLQESGHQFNVLDTQSDLSLYKVIILPDNIPLSSALAEKIETFLAAGGSLIASYKSGLAISGSEFVLPSFGVKLIGPAPYSPDFLIPGELLAKGLPKTEHVVYLKGLQVEPLTGTQILAQTAVPYFNRDYRHFCSHQHTPSTHAIGYPGILRRGNVIYFAHPIFSQYRKNASRWIKTLFLNALELLLPQPAVRFQGPSTLMVTLNDQPGEQRHVLHMLHYIPERRGEDFDTIEDVIPLYNIPVSIRADSMPQAVALVPQKQALPYQVVSGRIEFTVPVINGHQMIEIR